ncbi:hypothetical protein AAE02nite_39330 [Adhaeribacter aerolatus]|uniref:PKD domain-containing protein n=1 Tax=Adhaeribacter aerolatus TaxID=670289 RepID=A0A512B2U0_9BACT|nr:hypothetical protein [Adhaeribacter aerolatus]GEO06269.1 hypothetical protein AAE02nite_39330 [Adhaeribacter aerolatus]
MKTPKSFSLAGSPAKPVTIIPFQALKISDRFFSLTRQWRFVLLAFLISLVSCEEPETEIPKPVPEKGTVTAQAGPDVTIPLSQQVLNLDASASKDSQQKPLTFAWAVTRQPQNSHASYLTNPNQVNPTFNVDVVGEYELEVTVSSENGQSKDKLVVTVTNNGTPLVLESYIPGDRTLTNIEPDPTKADYFVPKSVEVFGKLTIEPGVVVEFEADTELHLKGAIIAKGTATQKIVFTGKIKQRGFWKGLLIGSGFQTNELDYVEVAYAGSSPMQQFHSNIKTNVGIGGLALTKITNSSFVSGGGYGMYVSGNLMVFAHNTFRDNASLPLYITATQVHKLDAASSYNTGENRKTIGIGGSIPFNYEVTWPAPADGTHYLALSDLEFEGGVTISPGVTIEFTADKGLYVRGNSGYLSAKGTPTQRITFTGLVKNKGYWKGISFAASKYENQLDYVDVAYGGSSNLTNMSGNLKTNVLVYGKQGNGVPGYLKVANSTFNHSGGYGMYVDSPSGYLHAFANNSFGQNAGSALFVHANQVHKLDAASRLNDNNGYNGVETAGRVYQAEEVTWPIFNDGAAYQVTDDLIFESGVNIRNHRNVLTGFAFAADKGLYVKGDGYLNAHGSSKAALLVFSSKTGAPWKGISIESNSAQNRFNYVVINRAGSSNLNGFGDLTSLGVRGTVTILNSTIKNSAGYGIFVKRSGSVNADAATSNSFENNVEPNFYKEQ